MIIYINHYFDLMEARVIRIFSFRRSRSGQTVSSRAYRSSGREAR